jgi:hypothetical protein
MNFKVTLANAPADAEWRDLAHPWRVYRSQSRTCPTHGVAWRLAQTDGCVSCGNPARAEKLARSEANKAAWQARAEAAGRADGAKRSAAMRGQSSAAESAAEHQTARLALTNHPQLAALIEARADDVKQAMFDAPIGPGDFEMAVVRFADDSETWNSDTSAVTTVRTATLLHQLGIVQEFVRSRKRRAGA